MTRSSAISCNSITRGNKFKLSDHTFHYDLRKYSFTPTIVNIWNITFIRHKERIGTTQGKRKTTVYAYYRWQVSVN